LTSSFRDLRLFLELAPWLCFVPLVFFIRRARFSPASASIPASFPLLPPHNPRRCSAPAHGALALSRRHVSAIFCAADGSCRDQPTNASNIPAHRVSPSRARHSSRNGIPSCLMLLSSSRVAILSFNRVNAITLDLSARTAMHRHLTLDIDFARRRLFFYDALTCHSFSLSLSLFFF